MPATRPRRRATWRLLSLAALLACACAHRAPMTERVGRIRFQGNGTVFQGTSDFFLRQAMQQAPGAWSDFMFPAQATPLDRATLAHDAWRVELWYAHHGYLDARFLGWDLRERRPARRRRPAIVDVTGRVSEGEPSLIREVTWEGLDIGGVSTMRVLIARDAAVQLGDRFSVEAVDETENLIRAQLADHGYAWVTVRTAIIAVPEEHAVDLRFTVNPGPRCFFGEVRVTGAEHIPEPLILDEVRIEPGRPFKARHVAETRRNLFALGTFSAVSVLPRQDEDDPGVVPVDIRLTEARFRRLKLGGGLGVESGQQDAHLTAGFQHADLAERLIALNLQATGGVAAIASYADLADGFQVQRWAPVVDAKADLGFPRVFGKGWRLSSRLAYEMGLESGYTFLQPSWTPSVTWTSRPAGREYGVLTLGTSYRLSYFDYLDLAVDLSAVQSSRLGLDLRAPYLLSYAEEQVVWDARDDPIYPKRGFYASTSLGMAGGPIGERGAPLFGQYDFVKFHGDLRNYTSLAPKLQMRRGFVLATRIAGGLAQPLGSGERAAVPYAERFMVGGSNSVRGWVTDHLGPRLCERTWAERGLDGASFEHGYGEVSAAHGCPRGAIVPLGGQVYAHGSIELRKDLLSWLGAVTFLDVGMAWADLAAIREQAPLPSAGAGVRFKTPIGPVRLDLGFRLDHDADFASEPPLNVHFSLSEAF
ncbi:MAG: BamA/TamA family outer membrane protein [Pseudomonadota bacterium]